MREALATRNMGKVIHAFRTHHLHGLRGIPQEIVGSWLELTQTQVSRIEKSPPRQNLEWLSRTARVLNIPHHLLWFAPQPAEEEGQRPTEHDAIPRDAVNPTESFGLFLRSLMAERDLSYRRLARLVHCDFGYLCRIAHDQKLPSHDFAIHLDEALEADGELLALLPPPEERATNRRRARTLEEDEMKRRAALQILTAISAGTAISSGMVETVLSGIEDALGGSLDTAEWERVVYEYGQRILIEPAGSLTGELTSDIIALGGFLKRSNDETVKKELLRVSAGLSGLLAIDLNDVGDKRAARISWSTAKRAADASGDRDLGVWVRAKEAQKACWADRPALIVGNLSAEAIEIANDAPSPGLARAHAAQAYLAADRGDFAEANTALDQLRSTFDSLPASMRTTYSQAPSSLHEGLIFWSEAYVYAVLGNKRADKAISQAKALSPGPAVNEELELFRALAMVRGREIDTGLNHALDAIDTRPLGTFRRRLTSQIVDALPEKARALPVARELRVLTSGAASSTAGGPPSV